MPDPVQLIRDLAVAATTRVDGVEALARSLETRLRAIETAQAEARGASLGRLVPWLALALSAVGVGLSIHKAF